MKCTLHPKRRIWFRYNKHSGRYIIEKTAVGRELQARPTLIPGHSIHLENECRSLSERLKCTATNLCQPFHTAKFMEDGCSFLEREERRWFLLPSTNLIPFCLKNIRNKPMDIILIAPYWASQHWFSTLMEMAVKTPFLPLPIQVTADIPSGEIPSSDQERDNLLDRLAVLCIILESDTFQLRLSSWSWLHQQQISTLH